MKLSIRMKIVLPVVILLIGFPLATWATLRYSLEVHMNFNARRDLEAMVRTVDGVLEEPEDGEEGDTVLSRLRDAVQTGAGEARMLVVSEKYRRTVRPSPHLFWKAPFLVQKKGHTQAPYTPKGSWSRPMEAPFFWMRSTPSIRPSRERSCGPWRPKSSAVWEAPGRSRVISVLFQP